MKTVTFSPSEPVSARQYLDALTEREEIARGEKLVALLGLKEARDQHGKKFSPARYHTATHGTKTALGLFRTLSPEVLGL